LLSFGALWRAGLIALTAASATANAQSAPEPAAIERTIPRQPHVDSVAPVISGLAPARAARLPETGKFTLGAVNIDGATAFSKADLSGSFEPMLATEVDGRKLAQIAARITERYRDSGFLLSYATVPSQDVEAGMVRVDVVEGRIGSLAIAGGDADEAAIEAIAAPLLKEVPLKSATLERAIGLMRDYPGVTVADVALSRTDAEAGIYALKITLKRNRTRAFTYMDNRGTQSAARTRLYTSASFSSVAVDGDELRADLFAMPGGKFRYLYGQVVAGLPIGRDGLRLTLSASRGDQYLRELERLDGDSTSLTAQLSYPVLRSRALTMVGKLSVNDWRSGASEHGVAKLRDHLRVARVGVDFSTETRTLIQGELALSRGLGFDGMTRVGDPLSSRRNAGGKFTKAEFALKVIRPLSDDFRLQAVVAGQYANRPLLSAEEFALGGNRIGRAFAFNAATAARGIGGGLELSYRLPQKKGPLANPWLFAFVDGGAAFDARPALTSDHKRSLASAGIGARFSIGGSAFSAEAGVPLGGPGGHSVRLFVSAYRPF
jgi:hemolysin activation/secretion protein